MGEMADDFLDSMLVIPPDDTPEDSYELKGLAAPTVTCRYCGKTGLRWNQTEYGAWRLFDPNLPENRDSLNRPHVCGQYRPRGTEQKSKIRRRSMGNLANKIVEGMSRALFVTAWTDYEEEQGRRYGGCEMTEIAPETPETAIHEAWRLIGKIEQLNGASLIVLLFWAARADGLCTGGSRQDWNDADDKFTYDFGWYLAMMSMGHGVSWFDDHAKFDLKTPDSENLFYNEYVDV